MGYEEDDFLMLSGIQHFSFCRRQWALIHIEQQWEENALTVKGQSIHKKADQPFIREKRGDKLIIRGLPVKSHHLGVSGICDVVELVRDEGGIPLANEKGLFLPFPVEYKKGKPKTNEADILQLVAQVICLEEMFVCEIKKAYLFYYEIKKRIEVEITAQLRESVKKMFMEMHQFYDRRHTPRVKTGSFCDKCSLNNICLPRLMSKESVASYIDRRVSVEEAT